MAGFSKMTRHLRHWSLLVFFLPLLLIGCGGSSKSLAPAPENPFDRAGVGTDSTLEVLTWNVENFAKAGNKTVNHLIDAIAGLDVDVVALQEIVSADLFQRVVDGLEGWDGYRASSAYGGQNLAYIYRTDGLLEVTAIYEILAGNSRPLPRRPLVLEGTIGGLPYVVINNHFKCCGDGTIDPSNSWDEETRRRDASLLLQQYVADNYADRRVIIVGDFNDELTDAPQNNVFQNFFDAPDQWLFTDLPIAHDSGGQWSYPSWPSHIDHVLINAGVFEDFAAPEATIRVLPLQSYLGGGWSQYNEEITDHLPVLLRLLPRPHPNPFMGARVGTTGTLEVMTWNLQQFGYPDQETELAALAIEAVDADVVMLQEVVSAAQFAALDEALTDYEGVLGTGAPSDLNLAVLYRNDGTLANVQVTAPLPVDPVNFVRPPLQLTAQFSGQDVAVLNVHHKCCGDGVLDTNEPYDEENRRYQANLLLKDYINQNLSQTAVIVAGDFNDLLDKPLADNVFLDFLLEPENWEFVDMDIATGDPEGWSMPAVPLQVDHILVNSELFPALTGPQYLTRVVPLADFMSGGWGEYFSQLSDHLPLVVRLEF
jgi:endonuclease/exonuclease/phosphatase family metal-dependent hydrolase